MRVPLPLDGLGRVLVLAPRLMPRKERLKVVLVKVDEEPPFIEWHTFLALMKAQRPRERHGRQQRLHPVAEWAANRGGACQVGSGDACRALSGSKCIVSYLVVLGIPVPPTALREHGSTQVQRWLARHVVVNLPADAPHCCATAVRKADHVRGQVAIRRHQQLIDLSEENGTVSSR